MSNVVIEKGFRVGTANRTGAASEVTNAISEAGHNLKGFWASIDNNQGQLFLVPENFTSVKQTLNNSSVSNVNEQEFIVVKTSDQAGTCATFLSKLANAGINVNSFMTTTIENQPAIIFTTDNNNQAAKVIA